MTQCEHCLLSLDKEWDVQINTFLDLLFIQFACSLTLEQNSIISMNSELQTKLKSLGNFGIYLFFTCFPTIAYGVSIISIT